MFSGLSAWQTTFILLSAFTWIIGGNVLVALHYVRKGKPWHSGLRPFVFPFRYFSPGEWRNLIMLAFLSIGFFLIAMYAAPK